MLSLELTKRTDSRLLERMAIHYSQPKGFVGRNRCFAIYWDNEYLGHLVGGSTPKHLPGRSTTGVDLNSIVNNLFYNINPPTSLGKYPLRNFTSYVLQQWVRIAKEDWQLRYGNEVTAFETLVELPRTGELYKKAGWKEVGITKGYTCKRGPGKGSDSWTGRRVWDTVNLRPKKVFRLQVE